MTSFLLCETIFDFFRPGKDINPNLIKYTGNFLNPEKPGKKSVHSAPHPSVHLPPRPKTTFQKEIHGFSSPQSTTSTSPSEDKEKVKQFCDQVIQLLASNLDRPVGFGYTLHDRYRLLFVFLYKVTHKLVILALN